MKKRIKKIIALLTLTVAVMGTSTTAMAASCQNVRYYGNHRYTERAYAVDKEWVLMYVDNGVGHFRVLQYYYGVCSDSMCGAHGKTGEAWVDKYKKIY